MGIVEETQASKNMAFVPATEIKGSRLSTSKRKTSERLKKS